MEIHTDACKLYKEKTQCVWESNPGPFFIALMRRCHTLSHRVASAIDPLRIIYEAGCAPPPKKKKSKQKRSNPRMSVYRPYVVLTRGARMSSCYPSGSARRLNRIWLLVPYFVCDYTYVSTSLHPSSIVSFRLYVCCVSKTDLSSEKHPVLEF